MNTNNREIFRNENTQYKVSQIAKTTFIYSDSRWKNLSRLI